MFLINDYFNDGMHRRCNNHYCGDEEANCHQTMHDFRCDSSWFEERCYTLLVEGLADMTLGVEADSIAVGAEKTLYHDTDSLPQHYFP